MKIKMVSMTLLVPLLLTSCSFSKTPKLYKQFNHITIVTKSASKKEWERREVGGGFSYVEDFWHGSRKTDDPKYFARIYHNDSLIYEEKQEEQFLVYWPFVHSDKLYYICSQLDISTNRTSLSCLATDVNGETTRFSLPDNSYCEGACSNGDFCFFFLRDRANGYTAIYKTNADGMILESIPISKDYYGLYSFGGNIYTTSSVFEDYKIMGNIIYRFNDDWSCSEISRIPFTSKKIEFGEHISAISYDYDYNNQTYTFYRTIDNTSTEICNFTVPDDLYYSFIGVEQFDEDIIIGFMASKKDVVYTLYSRIIFLYYDSSANQIFSYSPNQYLYNLLFVNNNVFYGMYRNHSTNGTNDGFFRKIIKIK